MGIFRRRKKARPKNPLGVALYDFDNLLNADLKKIKSAFLKRKQLNPKKVKKIYDRNLYKLDHILDDISKENLKIDYRSDKTRYKIIDLIKNFKEYLNKALGFDFDYEKIGNDGMKSFEKILEKREKLKKDMRDIESDYL